MNRDEGEDPSAGGWRMSPSANSQQQARLGSLEEPIQDPESDQSADDVGNNPQKYKEVQPHSFLLSWEARSHLQRLQTPDLCVQPQGLALSVSAPALSPGSWDSRDFISPLPPFPPQLLLRAFILWAQPLLYSGTS